MNKNEIGNEAIPHRSLVLGYKATTGPIGISVSRIENAIAVVARLVADGGDEYLPLFLRLEKELERQQENLYARKRAMKLVQRFEKWDTK